jgi:hypothetical protein
MHLDSGRLFQLEPLLSSAECEALIKQATDAGLEPVDWEYSPEYRKCDRVVVRSPTLATELWTRLRAHLERDDVYDVRPFGFDQQGTWRPIGVNECIRFTRYSAGDHFQPHRDGSFVVNDEVRSIYTVMIYLSSHKTHEGGSTKFFESLSMPSSVPEDEWQQSRYMSYESRRRAKKRQQSGTAEDGTTRGQCKFEIDAEPGKALCFTHDIWHSGEGVHSGFKYILRTDLMFERVSLTSEEVSQYAQQRRSSNTSGSKRGSELELDELFIKAEELYQRSIQEQQAGNAAASTDYYLQALDIQAQMPSTQVRASLYRNRYADMTDDTYPTLPSEIWEQVVQHLSLHDLVACMNVSKAWRYVVRAGTIWCNRYRQHFPHLWAYEATNHTDVTKDWYTVFVQRFLARRMLRIAVLDVGHVATKCAMSDSPTMAAKMPTPFPTAIQRARGHYWGARSGHKEFFVGASLMGYTYATGPLRTLSTVDQPHSIDMRVLGEIVRWCFWKGRFVDHSDDQFSCSVSITATPLLLAIPLAWERDTELLKRIQHMLLYRLRVPYVCLKSEAVLALASVDLTTGLAVITGTHFASVVPVVQGKADLKSARQYETKQLCNLRQRNFLAIEAWVSQYETPSNAHELYCGSDERNSLAHFVLKCIETLYPNDPELHAAMRDNVVLCGGPASDIAESFTSTLSRISATPTQPACTITVPSDPVNAIAAGGAKWATLSTSFSDFRDQTLQALVTTAELYDPTLEAEEVDDGY